MKSNIEIIKELYRHFASANYEGVKVLFNKNIFWEQMDGFPNGGKYKGADEIIQHVFNGFKQNWIGWKAIVTGIIKGENYVFVSGYYEGKYILTDKKCKADFMHQYRMQRGKIIHFKQYTDTALIANAMSITETGISDESKIGNKILYKNSTDNNEPANLY